MKKVSLMAATAFTLALPVTAQEAEPQPSPSPNQIVAEAPASEWQRIAPEDLLVMTLAPDAEGAARKVVIQLMPPPFSQGWVDNIRIFARAKWYDNISVNRVQDNYVVQWGDPNYDNPEATGDAKALPDGLEVMEEREYIVRELDEGMLEKLRAMFERIENREPGDNLRLTEFEPGFVSISDSPFGLYASFAGGFPYSLKLEQHFASSASSPHCYGMVGVGRGYSPDTGSGAELYTVIGHAPRHLDRNIALVGRVVEGMEYLSSLPRGKGELGFYAEDELDKRTAIRSVRVASDLPETEQPAFEYLSTESESFITYAAARANRRDPFFIVPAGGADICNIPVPVRPVASGE